MPITEFLNSNGFYHFEGNSREVPGQMRDLIRLTTTPNINIMEIGFNAGHSAELFLKNNPSATLTSFDLGIHSYVPVAKSYIDSTYSNRHLLFLGDSRVSVPEFVKDYPKMVFDVIFIDGGHDYEISSADIENCRRLANKDTIVIMDDTSYVDGPKAEYTLGPTRAWREYVESGKIIELGKVDYDSFRGMSWGKYVV